MAEKVWVVHVETWELRLMYAVDAREAVRLGDYAYAPVGATIRRRGRGVMLWGQYRHHNLNPKRALA